MSYEHPKSDGYFTCKAAHKYTTKFTVNPTNFLKFMKAASTSNAVPCIVHLRDDELRRPGSDQNCIIRSIAKDLRTINWLAPSGICCLRDATKKLIDLILRVHKKKVWKPKDETTLLFQTSTLHTETGLLQWQQFESPWDDQLGSIEAVQHWIELQSTDDLLIDSVQYFVEPKARVFENQETDRILTMNVVEPTPTERASPNVFVPKEGGILRFWVDYRN